MENKPKKSFLSRFKIKTDSALDDIHSKEDSVREYKSKMTKRVLIVFAMIIVGFIIAVILKAFANYKQAVKEYANQESRQVVQIKTDNFAIWQTAIQQKMKDEKAQNEKRLFEFNKKLEGTNEFLKKELPSIMKNAFDKIGKNIDELSNQNRKTQDSLSDKINEFYDKTNSEIKSLKAEIKDDFSKKTKDFDEKIGALDKKIEKMPKAVQQNSENVDFPALTEDASSLPIPSQNKKEAEGSGENEQLGKTEQVEKFRTYQIAFKVSPSEPKPEVENNQTEAFFDIYSGLAQGILLNGVNAAVVNQGNQEDSPVYISLLTKMNIANGEYTNVKDCLLIGNAVGELATETVKIRLVKISCVFTNQIGDRFVAEGSLKGWATDENSNIGLRGQLITGEGKIIRAAIPLAAAQVGFDYVTRKANDVNVISSGGLGDLQNSLKSGFSSSGSNTLSKMTDIYTKYLDSLTAVVSIMGGRKVTILFNGGEKIKLEPYKDDTSAEGRDFGISLEDDKYNYSQRKVYFENN